MRKPAITMRKLLLMTFMVVAFIASATAKTGNKSLAKTTVRLPLLTGFKQIANATFADIDYRQRKEWSVEVTGPEYLVELISAQVTGDRLDIKFTKNNVRKPGGDKYKLRLTVSSPELKACTLRGSGDFEAHSDISTDCLTMKVEGSGDIDLRGVSARTLEIWIKGSGDVETERCDIGERLLLSVEGSGDIDVKAKTVTNVKATVAGSGDIDIDLDRCETADLLTRGSGDIKFRGQVRQTNTSVHGSGEIDINGHITNSK